MEEKPKKRELWGYGVTAGYTIYAVATLAFVVYAFTLKVEIVTDQYYEKGLEHDKRTAARYRTAALPQQPDIQVRSDGRVAIALPSEHEGLACDGEFYLYRPSDLDLDQRKKFSTINGIVGLTFDPLMKGLWKYTLTWKADGVEYEIEESIFLD